jgi:hypothetical protein
VVRQLQISTGHQQLTKDNGQWTTSNHMPRPPSQHVQDARDKLLLRLRGGLHRPGDRFMSNRAIARHFHISYQTADRLVRELVAAGLLIRKPAAGTFLPAARFSRAARIASAAPPAAHLLFHTRARREGSFGGRLLEQLSSKLEHERIPWKVSYVSEITPPPRTLADNAFPILWETPAALNYFIRANRRALLLNNRPASGMPSLFIDSISIDDFSGGAMAAQLLADPSWSIHGASRRTTQSKKSPKAFCIVSGPAGDPRSRARVAGFLSLTPAATVMPARTWYVEAGRQLAAAALDAGKSGIFCCNDRLAQAIMRHAEHHHLPLPPLVGFDDAPVAEQLHLTTIAIPWRALVEAAIRVAQKRLSNYPATASHHIFPPHPVLRS